MLYQPTRIQPEKDVHATAKQKYDAIKGRVPGLADSDVKRSLYMAQLILEADNEPGGVAAKVSVSPASAARTAARPMTVTCQDTSPPTTTPIDSEQRKAIGPAVVTYPAALARSGSGT